MTYEAEVFWGSWQDASKLKSTPFMTLLFHCAQMPQVRT